MKIDKGQCRLIDNAGYDAGLPPEEEDGFAIRKTVSDITASHAAVSTSLATGKDGIVFPDKTEDRNSPTSIERRRSSLMAKSLFSSGSTLGTAQPREHGSPHKTVANTGSVAVVAKPTATAVSASNGPSGAGDTAVLVEKERKEEGTVKMVIYKVYAHAGADSLLFAGGVISLFVIAEASFCANDWWLAQWADDIFSETKDFYITVYCVIALIYVCLQIARSVAVGVFGYYAGKYLHREMIYSILYAPYTFFERTPTGRVLTRVSKDINDIDIVLADRIQFLLMTAFRVVSILIVISVASYFFVFAMVLVLIVYFFVANYYRSSSRELMRLEGVTRAPVLSSYTELTNGLVTIRAFHKEAYFTRRFRIVLQENLQVSAIYSMQKQSA